MKKWVLVLTIAVLICLQLLLTSCQAPSDAETLDQGSVASDLEVHQEPKSTAADMTEKTEDGEIESLPMQIDAKPAEYSLDMDMDAVPFELIYASDEKIIFWGCIGLFEYDLKEEAFSRTLDLSDIDCNQTQGDIHSEIKVSQDGNTVYIMRYGQSGEIEVMYSYDLINDILTKIQPTAISDCFDSFADINELGLFKSASDDFTGMEVVDLGNGRYGYMRFYGWLLSGVRYETNDREYEIFK